MKRRASSSTSSCGSSRSVRSPVRHCRRRRRQAPSTSPIGMDKGKKPGNFRWTRVLNTFFISFLAEQVKEGHKVDKGFKSTAMHALAKAVNDEFPTVNVTATHCSNHYRTLKGYWQVIKKAKDVSGAGWDESAKTIIMGEDMYRSYVEAHPTAEQWINKPIAQYDELALICGNDAATGAYASGSRDRVARRDISDDFLDLESSPDVATPTTAGPSSGKSGKSGSKRSRSKFDDEQKFDELLGCVKVISTAIARGDPMEFSEKLYEAITGMKEFPESILEAAYEHLMRDEVEGRMFLTRNEISKVRWMEKFALDPGRRL